MSEITLELEGQPLSPSLRSFSIREVVSRPFDVKLLARSEQVVADLEAFVGTGATFLARYDDGHGVPRELRVRGVCSMAQLLNAEPTGLSTYGFRLAPKLVLLDGRRRRRIHQHQTTVGIVGSILDEWGIEHEFRTEDERHPRFEYRVQHDESDLAFVQRLLEAAGIFYFFDHAKDSKLILSDNLEHAELRSVPLRYVDEEAPDVDAVTSLQLSHRVAVLEARVRDYHFLRRTPHETSREQRAELPLEDFDYTPGASTVEQSQGEGGDTPNADIDGAARADDAHLDRIAEMRVERAHAHAAAVVLDVNVLDVHPGTTFVVTGHPHPQIDQNAKLLATSTDIQGSVDDVWTILVEATLGDRPYRPPLLTRRPRIESMQSATVVGPQGEEIYTDEYGRVRVRFHWDGQPRDDEERSSCWIRVSQGWAGTGFGMMAIPRVGQEVLVGFLDGNPDQPVVMGRLYNAINPVPHRLPEKRTISTWRSQSTPGGGGGFNEIYFDDKRDEELVYMHAERDLEKDVGRDERHHVGNDRHVQIDHDLGHYVDAQQTEVTGADRRIIVRGDMSRCVHGHDQQRIKQQSRITVEKARHDVTKHSHYERVGGNSHVQIGGELRQKVGGKTSL
ncbi:MAG: type VI secretion system tip protein VgrG, partial [Myxococcales bacterium]|nr:type VI secretion system tip protein VgrG [Myxococcales bacterium]